MLKRKNDKKKVNAKIFSQILLRPAKKRYYSILFRFLHRFYLTLRIIIKQPLL